MMIMIMRRGQPLFSASITAQLRCKPWDGTPPATLLQVSQSAALCAGCRHTVYRLQL